MITWWSFFLGAGLASLVWSGIWAFRRAPIIQEWHMTGPIFQKRLIEFGKDLDDKIITIEINEN